MDEDDTEQLLEVGPEELTNEEFLDLEQEHIAEGEAREKRTLQEKKKNNPKKTHSAGFSRSFGRLQQAPETV